MLIKLMWGTDCTFQNMYIIEYHNDQKIYSRNRILIPKLDFSKLNNPNNKQFNIDKKKLAIVKIFIILMIGVLIARNILKAVSPIVNELCINQARSIATIVCNEQATIVMEKYTYEDLAVVIKSNDGKIQMVKLNIIPVNEIISDVALAIQTKLNDTQDADFGIRLGSFTGVKLLSGSGPYIKVKMSTTGAVETELESEFKTAGINQTLHQIYLKIKCSVCILTPFSSITQDIKNEILIAESIIVGDIPESYYNFNGTDLKESLQVVE